MPDYSELLSRIEQASGPDREIDAYIDVLLFGGETVWKQANYTMEMYPASRRASKNHIGGFANEHVPLYTASLDATVALVERMLPGCEICLTDVHPDFLRPGEPKHLVELMCGLKWVKYDAYPEPKYETTGSGKANSRPLALLTALFRALSAREAKDGE